MSDFIGAFWIELAWRTYSIDGFTFSLIDVVYASIILSIIGSFIEHFVRSWLSKSGD